MNYLKQKNLDIKIQTHWMCLQLNDKLNIILYKMQ
jgi:hypothetical protein